MVGAHIGDSLSAGVGAVAGGVILTAFAPTVSAGLIGSFLGAASGVYLLKTLGVNF